MKCLNTYGACQKEAVYIEAIDSNNFCSLDCFNIYMGRSNIKKPSRRRYDNQERQLIHDLYIWAVTGKEPKFMKSKIKKPPVSDWIIIFDKYYIYIWDDFNREYRRADELLKEDELRYLAVRKKIEEEMDRIRGVNH